MNAFCHRPIPPKMVFMHIDQYRFGSVSVAGESFTTDVIIGSASVSPGWRRRQGHCLNVEDLDPILEQNPEILVVGTGYYGRMEVPQGTLDFLSGRGIQCIARRTSDAVAEFNRLQTESARIVAALHLTC